MSSIFVQRRPPEERQRRYKSVVDKKVKEIFQSYYENGGTGSITLSGLPVTELPSGLKINGDLYAGYTNLATLPRDIQISGSIYLGGSSIQELPDTLTSVNGDLHLNDTPITRLPSNLNVKGSLELSNCRKIRRLPSGLVVDRSLFLEHAAVAELPPDLVVGENLCVRGSVLSHYSEEKLRSMTFGILGEIIS